MALAPGIKAPDFSLLHKHADGMDKVSLSGLLSQNAQVVLLFFPLAFSSVCTEELCSVSGGIDAYQGLNAKVVGISVDGPHAQEAFAKSSGISIPLLSDFNKEAAAAYEVLDENFLPEKLGLTGVAKRSAFVVGSDGNIKYSWSSDNPGDMPPFDEIQAALK
ncbi:MAG: redoxin domain-containing protein [Opitutales bacterium]